MVNIKKNKYNFNINLKGNYYIFILFAMGYDLNLINTNKNMQKYIYETLKEIQKSWRNKRISLQINKIFKGVINIIKILEYLRNNNNISEKFYIELKEQFDNVYLNNAYTIDIKEKFTKIIYNYTNDINKLKHYYKLFPFKTWNNF